MSAILFGSISSLADTSELQRQAFNDTFSRLGLDWFWDRDTYRAMLASNGGEKRVAEYAEQREDTVDVAAIHALKTDRFHELLATASIRARSGVVDCVRAARSRGIPVVVVTTTSPENVTAVLEASDLERTSFEFVLDADHVENPKPDPEVYRLALARLAISPGACIAIEDNAGGLAAATAAGVPCVAFPNENTAGHDFTGAVAIVDHLTLDGLLALVPPLP